MTIPDFRGEIHTGELMRTLYATDASVYRELPYAVILPRSGEDVGLAVRWAWENRIPLIPRGAGTSLAGQVVGKGVVMDVSKYLTRILEVDPLNRRVRVEPGVVRDQLNAFLKPYGVFFSPITSTASRANIGGMIGNNSCGSNSMVYGSVRDHLVEVRGYLSDGSGVVFKGGIAEMDKRGALEDAGLEGRIHAGLHALLRHPGNQTAIRTHFPPPEVTRRNTGYALDSLLDSHPFGGERDFNLCRLIAGSEGTLMVITEAVLDLDPLPPESQAVVVVHCGSVQEALLANRIALEYNPSASELIDDFILQCTKNNLTQRKNRDFVVGDPAALLAVEFRASSGAALEEKISSFRQGLGEGYSTPVLYGAEVQKVWDLRAAGLGVMNTLPGDAKPQTVVEDAAVNPHVLPDFIADYDREISVLGLKTIYYGHAGSGELHLRPVIDLKTAEGKKQFRQAGEIMAGLVKKYRGSLSGEHGDGRLRGEFLPQLIGRDNYRMFQEVKRLFDPRGILNPGKIVESPLMDEGHRYFPGQITREFETVFDFSTERGLLRAAEMCNGSGDCRKGVESGGTMCPSYRVLKDERETTRGRANMLREILTHGPHRFRKRKVISEREFFDSEEVREVMRFCLSCKGCKSECPSNVDIAKLKAEFTQQYYLTHSVPLSVRMIAGLPRLWEGLSRIPGGRRLYNLALDFPPLQRWLMKFLGFTRKRPLPPLSSETLSKRLAKQPLSPTGGKTVYFFIDEFTNHQDVEVGSAAIRLLQGLGYRVIVPALMESGRTAISKGLLLRARETVRENLRLLAPLITPETPLVGVEPSSLLTFRDEGIALLRGEEQGQMSSLAKNIFLLEEFLVREMGRGVIDGSRFTDQERQVICHVHCHQKALSDSGLVKQVLSLPKNYQVQMIPSGCCGMAGSFGYEAANYDLSFKIGELVLFPRIRDCGREVIIAATGISCREQIRHGTGRASLHPAQILAQALLTAD